MGERFLQVLWVLLLLAMGLVFLVIPTYHFGITGWLCGVGIFVHFSGALWLFEAIINYIKRGEFKPEDWD